MSEAKPLRWSFLLTFSIVLVSIWGVVLSLAHVQRAQLVGELRMHVTDGTVQEATAALRQLTHLSDPPIEAFVAAAASPSRKVALQAQSSITELLRKWQRQLKKSGRSAHVADRLVELAKSLHAERDSFATMDYPWLAKTTETIVRIANSAPPEDMIGLAIPCESLLALTSSQARGTPLGIVPVASAAIERESESIFTPPSRLALQSIVSEQQQTEATASETNRSIAPTAPKSTAPIGQPRKLQPGPDEFSQAPAPQLFYRRHRAAAKIAAPLPAEEIQHPNADSATPWVGVESRALLERWLAANGVPKLHIARELERRGFGSLRADVVRLALSNDTQGRVQLAYDLLGMRGTNAKPWLMLLAEDANAEVRLTAVTLMATSNDAELLEKAWQVALHDQDPRIAGLAEQLRARRQ